jgi:DNA-binding CsgD family transcriptional regulator
MSKKRKENDNQKPIELYNEVEFQETEEIIEESPLEKIVKEKFESGYNVNQIAAQLSIHSEKVKQILQ